MSGNIGIGVNVIKISHLDGKTMKYTKDVLEKLVKDCKSMRSLIIKLGIKYTGGNYSHIKSRLNYYDIDYSHFSGKGWRCVGDGKKKQPKEYLKLFNSDEYVSSDRTKKRILRDKIKEHRCEKCNISVWNDRKIPLELHHRDGNKWNNCLENLVLLCPNCHAQTKTFAGKKNKVKPL